MFKRTIKNDKNFKSKDIETLPINSNKLHPIILHNIETTGFINPICLTKMHISNDKLKIFNNYACNGENKYKDYIQLPPIGFTSSDLLQIYNINDIDSLNNWIDSNYMVYNENTFKRVLNCWIINNIETLKIHNNFLENICKKILKIKYPNDFNIDKEIKYYIDYWIDKYDINNRDLDLLKDLSDYLYKKIKN
jgi:hypothetical protein